MPLNLRAFVSYQTEDRAVAGEIKRLLDPFGIQSFLAHEDIEVSNEWRVKLLQELTEIDIFVCVLSDRYFRSVWCVQESGIAALRNITIIPLSIDQSIPKGFISHIQSVRINPDYIQMKSLIPAFIKRDPTHGRDLIIEMIGASKSYRGAEDNFALIMPHLEKLEAAQAERLLLYCVKNNQVHDAGGCAHDYIPAVVKMFPQALGTKEMKFLRETCRKYDAEI